MSATLVSVVQSEDTVFTGENTVMSEVLSTWTVIWCSGTRVVCSVVEDYCHSPNATFMFTMRHVTVGAS